MARHGGQAGSSVTLAVPNNKHLCLSLEYRLQTLLHPMKDPLADDQKQPKGEEFPIEDFDGVSDWNLRAWEIIEARNKEALRKKELAEYLSEKPTATLYALLKVCINEQQDVELQELIRNELNNRNL